MKASVAALALALAFVGFASPASAQADRTMGVNCTVAGHVHCGEYGSRYGRSGLRAFGAAYCRVVVRHLYRHGREITVRSRRCY